MKLLIRFDDIAENMNWHLMEKCEDLFDKYNIKPVLGVIPNNQDPELKAFPKIENFWEKVRGWQSKGWEISMHGYKHLYEKETNKKDYFKHGGKSEFFGHSLIEQTKKIKKGLEIFKKNKIKIRSFFSPNHTYDINTFLALKESGIDQIIDGYGFVPYTEHGIKFIPQLFYKPIIIPLSLQTTQIHLNTISEDEFERFKNLIISNHKNIINYEDTLKLLSNNIFHKILNKFIYLSLLLKRSNFRF